MAKKRNSVSKTGQVRLRVSAEEKKIFQEVAEAKHAPISVVVRQLIYREHEQIKKRVA